MDTTEIKRVACIIYMQDEKGKVFALLNRRNDINADDETGHPKKQSFAGVCQLTSIGKKEPNEDPTRGAKRECWEELGLNSVTSHHSFFDTHAGIHYLLMPLRLDMFGDIHLEPGSAGLVQVYEEDLAKIVSPQGEDWKERLEQMAKDAPRTSILMFRDEFEILEKTFPIAKKHFAMYK